ncbi:hypothetical protein NUW54_g11390 [Trametes sanguinea]|uniref:Uncharacterized protein n=1 Tax=Trametes sanguinea TaxID=158606 RepID=A0ACC1NFU0_9APHY|nr:hypothetical protein NUW54_g11390 [Trametes sanguinea]
MGRETKGETSLLADEGLDALDNRLPLRPTLGDEAQDVASPPPRRAQLVLRPMRIEEPEMLSGIVAYHFFAVYISFVYPRTLRALFVCCPDRLHRTHHPSHDHRTSSNMIIFCPVLNLHAIVHPT